MSGRVNYESSELVGRGKQVLTEFGKDHLDKGRKQSTLAISKKKWAKKLAQRMKEQGL